MTRFALPRALRSTLCLAGLGAFAVTAHPDTVAAQQAPSTQADLVALFDEWRAFERPEVNG